MLMLIVQKKAILSMKPRNGNKINHEVIVDSIAVVESSYSHPMNVWFNMYHYDTFHRKRR